MRALILAAFVALAATLAHAPVAQAAWASDPYLAQVAVCTASGTQSDFSVCSDAAGGVIVAWVDQRPGATTDVYAQRINASGNPVWAADGVPVCTVTGTQTNPQIVPDGTGGAFVVWMDRRNLVTDDIYAQRLNSSGVRQWSNSGVLVSGASGNQRNPTIAADGFGGFVTSWWDERNAATSPDVYAQRVNANGALLWTGGGLFTNGMPVSTAANDQSPGQIVSDGAGGAIVTWNHELSAGEWDVYAQRLSAASGAEMWTSGGVPVVNGTGYQLLRSTASDGVGGLLVTFMESGLGNHNLRAQRVGSTGTVRWLESLTDMGFVNDKSSSSSIVPDNTGGFFAVHAYTGTPVLQRIGAGGAPGWASPGVTIDNVSGWGQFPRIVPDGAGGCVVVYMGPNTVLRAARVSGGGTAQWSGTWIPVQSAYYAQSMEVVATTDQHFIVVWQAYNEAGSDLHAQRFDVQGALGAPEPVMTGVRDVRNDQGGRVRVSWNRSDRDVEWLGGIVDYRVWRSVSVAALSGRKSRAATSDADAAARTGDLLVLPDAANGYAWELVATQAAASLAEYSVVTDTEADSLAGSNPRTAFMVEARAGTASTSQRWFSQPDSGYSVDDLAPAQPAPFVAVGSGGGTQLHWGANTESDLAFYRVYRGADPAFTPGPATFVGQTTDTTMVDAAARPLVYKLVAVDVHGNTSPWATAMPAGSVDAGDGARGQALSLSAPQPNPARAGVGVLRFTLPVAGAATVRLYDAPGRVRATLANGRFAAGEHVADLRDAGRLPAGLYLARLDGPGGSRTQRVVIVE